MKIILHSLGYVNPWSPASDAVGGRLSLGQAVGVHSLVLLSVYALFPAPATTPPHHNGVYPSGTVSRNKKADFGYGVFSQQQTSN